ncbi:MAG: HAD family hydrolase [Solirubrobacterales bacterium]|nr:HAD family hydrolase [Solirubrobacterales bacterium]
MLLLLFDIDGTLLSGATEAHRDAMYEALREVHGISPTDRALRAVAPAGRTDPEIARAILLDAGVSAERIDDRADDVREHCCQAYARLCPDNLSEFVVPGIPDLLDQLSALTGVTLALLTGNYEAVARLKLARAGIGSYFKSGQGAFGSDAQDRVSLPAIARRRAGTLGHPHPPGSTIVIGDTPRDIACAAADGVRCFAVASGPYRPEDLTQADAVFRGARELAEGLRAELG